MGGTRLLIQVAEVALRAPFLQPCQHQTLLWLPPLLA
jgi:hypothetical protein